MHESIKYGRIYLGETMNYVLTSFQKKYPLATIQDYVKLLYQSEFAGGHLIQNPYECYLRFIDEIKNNLNTLYEPLYETMSDELVRVNLRPFQTYFLNIEDLFQGFLNTANHHKGTKENFLKKLSHLLQLIQVGVIKLNYENAISFMDEYQKNNYPILHHSTTYRNAYLPSYRIIHKKYLTEDMKYIQAIHYIKNFTALKETCMIAIEGKCASGKTTLSNRLYQELGVTVIHVDDFFLEQKKKTIERLQEFGGNLNYELLGKVLSNIKHNKPYSYSIFNCTTQMYEKKLVEKVNKIVIVEGVYSMHPSLQMYYDACIYLEVNSTVQLERLQKRGEHLLLKFIHEWIPLENKYFKYYQFENIADIII